MDLLLIGTVVLIGQAAPSHRRQCLAERLWWRAVEETLEWQAQVARVEKVRSYMVFASVRVRVIDDSSGARRVLVLAMHAHSPLGIIDIAGSFEQALDKRCLEPLHTGAGMSFQDRPFPITGYRLHIERAVVSEAQPEEVCVLKSPSPLELYT